MTYKPHWIVYVSFDEMMNIAYVVDKIRIHGIDPSGNHGSEYDDILYVLENGGRIDINLTIKKCETKQQAVDFTVNHLENEIFSKKRTLEELQRNLMNIRNNYITTEPHESTN